jgi:hypothetical protein
MRRTLIAGVGVVALVLFAAATVTAKGGGPTRAGVTAHGWTCFDPAPVPGELAMVHCVHPNTDLDALLAGTLAAVPSLNFDLDGVFVGTEILKRADLGSDARPCRQGTQPDGTYEPVDFSGDGVPEYYSCHHNNDV